MWFFSAFWRTVGCQQASTSHAATTPYYPDYQSRWPLSAIAVPFVVNGGLHLLVCITVTDDIWPPDLFPAIATSIDFTMIWWVEFHCPCLPSWLGIATSASSTIFRPLALGLNFGWLEFWSPPSIALIYLLSSDESENSLAVDHVHRFRRHHKTPLPTIFPFFGEL